MKVHVELHGVGCVAAAAVVASAGGVVDVDSAALAMSLMLQNTMPMLL